jgi:hypothetical protein
MCRRAAAYTNPRRDWPLTTGDPDLCALTENAGSGAGGPERRFALMLRSRSVTALRTVVLGRPRAVRLAAVAARRNCCQPAGYRAAPAIYAATM